MTAKNQPDRLAALRTIIPAILALTLIGALPNWVEIARAAGYYDSAEARYQDEILGSDGTGDAPGSACAAATGDFEATCDTLKLESAAAVDPGSTPEERAAAEAALAASILSISPRAAQSAASNAITQVFSGPSSAISRQVGAQMARRRDGASGFSVAGVRIDEQRLNDGEMHFFDDSAAGADLDGRLGAFLNGVGGFGEHDATSEVIGFDYSNGGLVAGIDYQFSDQFLAGVSFNWITSDTDFDGGLGGVDKDTVGGSVYSTLESGDLHIDTILNYSSSDSDLTRRVTVGGVPSTATANYDSDEVFFSIGGGYDLSQGDLTLGPVLRFDTVKIWVDGYNEVGSAANMAYNPFELLSFTSNLGGEASYSISTDLGVFKPEIRILWVREFENDSQVLASSYVGGGPGSVITTVLPSPDRNFMRLGGGFTLEMTNGVSAWFDYETLLGFEDITSHQFSVGGRIEFSGGP